MPVARLFFPQSASLGIDLDSVSPVLLRKVVYAGSNNPSFGRAAHDLRVLAEVTVAVKQVERLTKRIGQQRHEERDAATAAWLERPLIQREEPPADAAVAPLAVVEMDGGRLQIRPVSAEHDADAVACAHGVATATASASCLDSEATTAAQPSPTVAQATTAAQPSPTTAQGAPSGPRPANTGVKTRWAAC